MKTLGSVSSRAGMEVERRNAAGGTHPTSMARKGHSRSARAGGVLAARWRDQDDEYQRRRTRSTPAPEDAQGDIDDELTEFDWDEVADVVCVGRGRIGVAVGAAARRAGLHFILADRPGEEAAEDTEGLAELLSITDAETAEYLRALTEDFTPLPPVDPTIPVRVVDGPLHPELPRDRLATFHGDALKDWAASCVSSPYGVLYTRVTDPSLAATYTSATGPVEATVLDTINIDLERPADSLADWLSALGQGRDAEPRTQGSLKRLVFDNGVVVGAILESANGARSIRARHGVMMTIRDGIPTTGHTGELNRRTPAEVALVSNAASRFARLELFIREPS